MARLNIEDQFWLDIFVVASKLGGDMDRAIGNAIRFFRYAQEKHKSGMAVSEDEFKALGFVEELIPIFAKRTPDGIECAGAEKYFGWLLGKSESGRAGGRVSAQRPRDEKGRLLSKQSPSKVQADSKQDPSKTKHSQASTSSSLSISNKNINQKPKANPRVLVEVWNSDRGPFSAVESLTDKRKTSAKAQLEKYPDLAHWRAVLERWKKSEFCTTKWKPTFDDWLNESKRIATIEGRYDDRKSSVTNKNAPLAGAPAPIRYEQATDVIKRQEADRGPLPEDRAEAAARVREMLAEAGKFGIKREGA